MFFVRPAIVFLALASCSCKTLQDRWADAKDVVTITLDEGVGARAQVGPADVGFGFFADFVGIRSGCFGTNKIGHFLSGFDVQMLFIGVGASWHDEGAEQRSKYYSKTISWLIGRPEYTEGVLGKPPFPPYYTQVEVAVAFEIGGRVGVNPGEFLDFMVGWFGLDLYRDDIAALPPKPEPPIPPPPPPAPSAPPAVPR